MARSKIAGKGAAKKSRVVKKKPAAAKQKPKPKPKPKVSAPKKKPAATAKKKKPAPKKKPAARKKRAAAATAQLIATPERRGRVVEILDDAYPIDALARFLATLSGPISVQDGQVALGSAQLILLPIAREHRGGPDVHALLDLVLDHWDRFPDRDGFHAQEFLRNAFAAVGDDAERIELLMGCLPSDPSPELLFSIGCAYAVARDEVAMIVTVRAALASGVSAGQIRRESDFAAFLETDALSELLDGARPPTIPVNIAPFVPSVRWALGELRTTLEHFGDPVMINPPADLAAVLELERTARIQLPNDYRALLTIADGCTLFDRAFFSLADYGSDTPLAIQAREYLETSARYGATGIDECVPLANWGQPNDWLLYDPHGRFRRGEPGYVLMLNADERRYDDLVSVIERLNEIARDELATN